MPTSPVLSGSPLYNGPIAIEFSTPQAGVGLIGGYFNAVGSTAITAYGVDGSIIGEVANSQIGDEFLGLVTGDGSATIAGLLFHLVGDEPAGFDVDNIRFGTAEDIVVPTVPEPASIALLAAGLSGIGFARHMRGQWTSMRLSRALSSSAHRGPASSVGEQPFAVILEKVDEESR